MKGLGAWWDQVPYVNRVAFVFIGLSLVITLLALFPWMKPLRPTVWVPSLVCNLFTTGLTIYFVNYVFVERDRKERDDKVREVARVVMLSAQPHVHSLLQRMLDPQLRMGPVNSEPEVWQELTRQVSNKMDTYQAVLDSEFTGWLETIRNCTQILERMTIEPEEKISGFHAYMTLGPLVVACQKVRHRFFPNGDEIVFGGMLPLLQEYRRRFPEFPELSTFT